MCVAGMTDDCPFCLVPVENQCAGGILDGLCYSAARAGEDFASTSDSGSTGCGAIYNQCELEAPGGRVTTREELEAWTDWKGDATPIGNAYPYGLTSTFGVAPNGEDGAHWLHDWSVANGFYTSGTLGVNTQCNAGNRYFVCVKPYYSFGTTSCQPMVGDGYDCTPGNVPNVGDRCEW